MSPEELVDAALDLGLDAIAVTDHGRIEGAGVTRELGQAKGLLVLRGVEVYTGQGDMLVYGVYEDIRPYESAVDLIDWVHEQGGAVVAAHPFRGGFGLGARTRGFPSDDVLGAVDAIEALNGADSGEARALAAGAAERLARPIVGGSDAHHPFDVGRCATVLDRTVGSEEEFVAELLGGRLRGSAGPSAPRQRWW
jgi:hypothetical protein